MSESSVNESILKSMLDESNGLLGEQNQRLKAASHLLHEAIAIIKEQQATIAILDEIIEHKDATITIIDETIKTLKGIGRRYQQILEAEGIS